MLFRSLLERKVPHLINESGETQIDNGVLRALLKIRRYKHESRSMEAILEMSMLTNAKKWEQSSLPSKEQLKLHVDEEQFLRHLMHDAFYSEKIEELAIAIHKKYLSFNRGNEENNNILIPWNKLNEEVKNYYREQVKHIPNSLLKINYDLVSVNENREILEFTQQEVEVLAKSEHTHWYSYRKKMNLKCNEIKYSKRDPNLVCWEKLSDEKKNEAYEMVKVWPEILAKSNFKLDKLKFLCNCEAKL